MTKLHTLTFEIGTEEIPAFDLHKATLALPQITEQALASARIPHGDIKVLTTPRRLIVMVDEVADMTEALDEVFRGPSVAIAFDDEGNPTKAAQGFARGKGVAVEDLQRRVEGDIEYVFATRSLPACDVAALLPEVLGDIISAISWPKSCRWGRTHEYFSRPVRWLVALLDEQVIPVEFAGLVASNETYGHRFLSPGPHKVPTAKDLPVVLESAYVVTSEQAREQAIRLGVAQAEQTWNAHAELPEKTLLEVTNLCEYPTVLVGTFDEEFLLVPEEIIVDAMLMHQRYFPLYDDNHTLTNHFILVSNGDPECASTIIDGNERVVRARLSDAKFFYEEDLKRSLDAYVDRLDEVVFQESLGTMREKTERVVKLAQHLALDAGLNEADSADVARAAYLAKADLVTNAVVEFTSVQGVMGSYYATASGETDQVAQAIADHYRPRFAGDELPESVVGCIVATADKLDTICGLFVVGQGPTGSSDPFALRRSAIGIIAMLEAGLRISLVDAINASLDTYQASGVEFDRQAIYDQIVEFFVTRTKVILRDGGISPDSVEAVLATGIVEPAVIIARARALEAAREQSPEVFDDLATAYARAHNLADAALGNMVDESLMDTDELALDKATNEAALSVERALSQDDYAAALQALASLRSPIDAFFEDVLIMDKDEALRNNRLRLLNRFVAVFAHVADFAKMTKASK
ncbi:glycine--tRNA ligase subunit beta [Eggerthellaceae bacterium 3-80]|nr:glycine--tRNA ligase subunit beta [bacterium D16-34]